MIENIAMERFENICTFAERHSTYRGGIGYARLYLGTDSGLYERAMSSVLNFDGIVILLCTGGELHVDVNLESYTLATDNILILGPRTVVRLTPGTDMPGCELEILFLTTDFVHTITIDLNSFNTRLVPPHTPLMSMRRDEALLIRRTLDLLYDYMSGNSHDDHYFSFVTRSILATLMYQLMQSAERRLAESLDNTRPKSRRINYVQNFISLVHMHHTRERSVAFYADKLCISPKYLSMIIKEATGRSASDIIDDFVITQAKNLLRYSGKNIQQIAYDLNFTNQSSFGKYFKHVTGMSPTKFQSK